MVGSRRRLDLSLPDGTAVAELLPEIVDMLDESDDGVPARWALVKVGGHRLDPERGLAEQDVADGTMLFLRDLTVEAPPPQIDDYAERVAVAVDAQGGRWTRNVARAFVAGGAAACLIAAGLVLLGAGDRGERAVVGIVGAALVSLAAVGLDRGVRRRWFGALLTLAALPLWAAAGLGLAGLAGWDATGMLASALGAVSVGAALAIVVAGDQVLEPAIGVIAATLLPAVVLAGCQLAGTGFQAAAALIGPLDLGGLALVAPLAARLASIQEAGTSDFGARLRRARHLVSALLTGICVALVASSVVLAVSGGWFARGVVVAVALSAAAKARHFRFAAEVVPLLAAGLAGVLVLEYPLVARAAIGFHGVGGAAGLLFVDAFVLLTVVAAAGSVQGWDLPARWKRWLGRLDALATAASVPLALGILGSYDAAAHFARTLT